MDFISTHCVLQDSGKISAGESRLLPVVPPAINTVTSVTVFGGEGEGREKASSRDQTGTCIY